MAGEETAGYPTKLQRVVVDPTRAPRAAHGFNWARLGNEYVLEVGFIDFAQAHDARSDPNLGPAGVPRVVPLFIIERFSISQEAAFRLSETVSGLITEINKVSEDAMSKSNPEPTADVS